MSITEKFNSLAARMGVSPIYMKTLTGSIEGPAGAERVEMMTEIFNCLEGSYNRYGMRLWLERPRTQLNGLRPRDILHDDWDPRAEGPKTVLKLAQSLKH
jgi:hypothetical protein